MAQMVIGKVSIIPCGEFQPNTKYSRLSVVSYEGSSYIAVSDNENTPVTDTTVWYLLAEKGEQGEQGIQGEKGDKGDTYEVTQEDLNAIAAQITSDASSAFNQNVTQKTNDFNNNAVAKTTAFDNNATTKTTDFNNNATTKTTDFDNNATQQTEDFDVHVNEQIEYFNDEVEGYVARLNILENDSALLESNFSETIPSPSDNVMVSDSFNATVVNATLIGKTQQNSYTGKNKLNIEDGTLTQYGITVTILNGKISITGTTTENSLWVKLTNGIAMNSGTPTSSNKPAWWRDSLLTGGQYTFSRIGTGTKLIAATLVGESSTTSLMPANTTSRTLDLTNSVLSDILIYLGSTGTVVNEEFYIQAVEGETADFEFEPYVGGVAAPSPDYPQPLNNVEGNVVIESNNENKLGIKDVESGTALGLQYSVKNDELIINGTSTSSGRLNLELDGAMILKSDKSYTLSKIETGTFSRNIAIQLRDTNRTIVIEVQNNVIPKTYSGLSTIIASLNLYIASGVTFTNYRLKLQLQEGSTATTYIQHKGKTITFPLATGQKMYEGDYLASDGIHHVRKQIDMGDLNYQYASNYNYFYLSTASKLLDMKLFASGELFTGKSTVYIAAKVPGSASSWENRPTGTMAPQVNGTDLRIKDTRFTVPTDLKTALTGQILEYPLAEDEVDAYTEAQQTAWDELQQLETYKNISHVYTQTTGLCPDVNFVYLQDPTVEINNRLTALEQAVVAQNSNN